MCQRMKEKYIEVSAIDKLEEIKYFLQQGDFNLAAAQAIFKSNSFLMLPAVTLCHHGIELLLKAFCIYENNKYLKSHKLLAIAKEIKQLNLSKTHWDMLKKIDTFFFYRYPITDQDYNRIEIVLKEIKASICGLQLLPGEIGDEDLIMVLDFYNYLYNNMPEEMYDLYEENWYCSDLN